MVTKAYHVIIVSGTIGDPRPYGLAVLSSASFQVFAPPGRKRWRAMDMDGVAMAILWRDVFAQNLASLRQLVERHFCIHPA
jgi:hypothetical protein